jgi:hypothetical protein
MRVFILALTFSHRLWDLLTCKAKVQGDISHSATWFIIEGTCTWAAVGLKSLSAINRCPTFRSVASSALLRWVHTCNVTAHRNAVTLQVTDTIRSYGLYFHPVPHDVRVSCERYTMEFPVCYGSQKHHECKEGERSGRCWRVTLHVQTCSGRNRIIPLMRRPNTDSAPNMLVTLPRNQLLIRNVVTSHVHTVTIRCYGTR